MRCCSASFTGKAASQWTAPEVQQWLQWTCFTTVPLAAKLAGVDGGQLVSLSEQELIEQKHLDRETATSLCAIATAWDQPIDGEAIYGDGFLLEYLLSVCWAAGCGHFELHSALDTLPQAWAEMADYGEKLSQTDVDLSHNCLRMLIVCATVLPDFATQLVSLKHFSAAAPDLLLRSPHPSIRARAKEWLSLLVLDPTKLGRRVSSPTVDGLPVHGQTADACPAEAAREAIVDALVENIPFEAKAAAQSCGEFFAVLCHLLTDQPWPANRSGRSRREVLGCEIEWLRRAKRLASCMPACSPLLAGHLNLTRTLLEMEPHGSYSDAGIGSEFVSLLTDTFLFPSSGVLNRVAELELQTGPIVSHEPDSPRKKRRSIGPEPPAFVDLTADFTQQRGELAIEMASIRPLCVEQSARSAAFSLLIRIVGDEVESFAQMARSIVAAHSCWSGATGWNFELSVGSRSTVGYVGLKNLGATCYMNSIMQNLFMQPQIRAGILSAAPESDADKQVENALHQVQSMFVNLFHSKLEFYNPEGFCRAFKDFDGQPMSLHEHQDAYEFFNRLVDQIDESLNAVQSPKILQETLGGSFTQQITSKTGELLSETEQEFTSLSLVVKDNNTLVESLSSMIKGDLLEGENAYHCDKTKSKIDAIKRTCIKALPTVLIMHLQRFEYNWQIGTRECPTHPTSSPLWRGTMYSF